MAKKIFAGCLALGILGGLAYYSSYLYSSRQLSEAKLNGELEEVKEELGEEQEKAEENEVSTVRDTRTETEETGRLEATAKAEAVREEQGEVSYYLIEEFGYVNIYLADKETLYEYTDIAIGLLPEELQQEICLGKAVAGEQELYDFLENYSS